MLQAALNAMQQAIPREALDSPPSSAMLCAKVLAATAVLSGPPHVLAPLSVMHSAAGAP